MRIKNKLAPYPVLKADSEDYINSTFEVDCYVESRFSEIYGQIRFKVVNYEIEKLINDKKAQYVAHIECPSTCYRTIITSYGENIDFSIDAKQISRAIEIRTFIVLTDDVVGFMSDDFHPYFKGQSFNLANHQIIAIGTAKDYEISKSDDEIGNLPSIFRIVKLDNQSKGALTVNTDSNLHIIIGLSTTVFQLYSKLGRRIFQKTALSLILLPAIMIVLQRMHENREDESFTSMHWYQVISNILERHGFDIANIDINNDTLLSVCQSIFANPILRSFEELDKLSERM